MGAWPCGAGTPAREARIRARLQESALICRSPEGSRRGPAVSVARAPSPAKHKPASARCGQPPPARPSKTRQTAGNARRYRLRKTRLRACFARARGRACPERSRRVPICPLLLSFRGSFSCRGICFSGFSAGCSAVPQPHSPSLSSRADRHRPRADNHAIALLCTRRESCNAAKSSG